MLAAVLTTPPRITAGKPTPACSSGGRSAISPAVALMMAFGVGGCGVSTRTRGVVSSPVAVSTTAALMPRPADVDADHLHARPSARAAHAITPNVTRPLRCA